MSTMTAPQKYRQRYLAFKIGKNLGKRDLIDTLQNICKENEYKRRPRVLVYNSKISEGLIRCRNDEVKILEKEIRDRLDQNFEVFGVSGTIKKARQKFLSF